MPCSDFYVSYHSAEVHKVWKPLSDNYVNVAVAVMLMHEVVMVSLMLFTIVVMLTTLATFMVMLADGHDDSNEHVIND